MLTELSNPRILCRLEHAITIKRRHIHTTIIDSATITVKFIQTYTKRKHLHVVTRSRVMEKNFQLSNSAARLSPILAPHALAVIPALTALTCSHLMLPTIQQLSTLMQQRQSSPARPCMRHWTATSAGRESHPPPKKKIRNQLGSKKNVRGT